MIDYKIIIPIIVILLCGVVGVITLYTFGKIIRRYEKAVEEHKKATDEFVKAIDEHHDIKEQQ